MMRRMPLILFTILCTLFGIFALAWIFHKKRRALLRTGFLHLSAANARKYTGSICAAIALYALFRMDKQLLFLCMEIPSWLKHTAQISGYLISPPVLLTLMGSIGLYGLIKHRFAIFSWRLAPLCASQLIAEGINRGLKVIIGRSRPDLLIKEGIEAFRPLIFDSHYHSLPSGHATGAFVLATSLAALYPHKRRLFYALASFFALSRLIISHHYASDVLAGAIVGICAGILTQKKIEQAKSLLDPKQ